MSDASQLEIPQSFVALFITAPGRKPSAPRAEVQARYALCEDLATLLTDTAHTMLHQLGITEHDVLERCLRGLRGEDAVVNAAEAQWVVTRLAELCNWPLPDNLVCDQVFFNAKARS